MWSFSSKRISSISNAAGSVSIRTVALIVPAGIFSARLRMDEDVVPEPRLEMALHLRQVEIRTGPRAGQRLRVVEEEHAEVEQHSRRRPAVDEEVALGQVKAARTDQQRRDLGVERVALAGAGFS